MGHRATETQQFSETVGDWLPQMEGLLDLDLLHAYVCAHDTMHMVRTMVYTHHQLLFPRGAESNIALLWQPCLAACALRTNRITVSTT